MQHALSASWGSLPQTKDPPSQTRGLSATWGSLPKTKELSASWGSFTQGKGAAWSSPGDRRSRRSSMGALSRTPQQPQRDPLQAVLDRAWEQPKPKAKSAAFKSPLVHASPGTRKASRRSTFPSCDVPSEKMSDQKSRWFGGGSAPDNMAMWLADGTPQKKNTQKERCYQFLIGCQSPKKFSDPKLRGSPQGVKRGSLRLSCGVADLSACERQGDSSAVKTAFTELSSQLHMLVHQTCITMNDLIATIRDRHFADPVFLSHDANYRSLAQIVFEVSSTRYHFAKWCHELDPEVCSAAIKPSRTLDASVADLLSQLQSGVSRMQVHASHFYPMLQQIVRAARKGQRGVPEDISENLWELAEEQGLSTTELLGVPAHMEHLLSDTQHLASAGAAKKRDRPCTAPSGSSRSNVTAPSGLLRSSTAPSLTCGSKRHPPDGESMLTLSLGEPVEWTSPKARIQSPSKARIC